MADALEELNHRAMIAHHAYEAARASGNEVEAVRLWAEFLAVVEQQHRAKADANAIP